MDEKPDAAEQLPQLIDDADYVLAELVRGDAVPGQALKTAQPLLTPVAQALFACRASPTPKADDIIKLQNALAALMAAIAPISVLSLRDTAVTAGGEPGFGFLRRLGSIFLGHGRKPAPEALAYRFSARFWLVTIVVLFLGLFCTYLAVPVTKYSMWQVPEDVKAAGVLLAPFFYGAMGACVFLLRSLHKHIYARTFDRRRSPEYYNRLLLGLIGGGIIVLLIDPSATPDAAKIPASALGFLAGYNNDLLFSAIERITNAIFPKPADPAATSAATAGSGSGGAAGGAGGGGGGSSS